MRFLSTFTGIGGIDLGLERAGMECVGQVEIEPYCVAVLEKHWPQIKRMRDIRGVRGNEFGAVELVCGGFPCQPFSCAGKRKGERDNRYLWPEMFRVYKATAADWFLGENVAGIIGVELDKVLSDLEGYGCAVQCFVIPACAVDAPHRRDRVWIVGHRVKQGLEGFVGNGSGGGEPGRFDKEAKRPIGETGVCGDVADTQKRTERAGFCEGEPGGVGCGRFDGGGENLLAHADSNGEGERCNCDTIGGVIGKVQQGRDCENSQDPGPDLNNRSEGQGCKRQPECRLGGMVDGVSRWLDEPAGLPRITKGQKNRIARLRALGNAVVPQVVEQIGLAIMKAAAYDS